jgi:predicted dehydrogenase
MQHKIGYIGFGGMAGGYHCPTAQRDDVPFTPVAAYDINPDSRANAVARGLKAYDNLNDFLASHEFDFVVVATSNQFHCPMVCRALEAGYDVMCEKPVAMTSAEVELMIATAEKCGRMFTVHHNRRWDRDFMIVKEAIENGDIGTPYMLENRVHSENGAGTMNGWRGFADHGGGMLVDWGVHMLDQVLYLVQEPVKTVSANIRSLKSEEVDDYSKVIITFESGLVAQVEVTTYSPIALPKWVAYGDTGALIVPDFSGNNAKVRRIKKGEYTMGEALGYTEKGVIRRPQRNYRIDEWEEFPIPHGEIPQDWASLYKNVAAALDGKEELIVKPAQVLRCFKVIEAAVKSAKEGVTVKF